MSETTITGKIEIDRPIKVNNGDRLVCHGAVIEQTDATLPIVEVAGHHWSIEGGLFRYPGPTGKDAFVLGADGDVSYCGTIAGCRISNAEKGIVNRGNVFLVEIANSHINHCKSWGICFSATGSNTNLSMRQVWVTGNNQFGSGVRIENCSGFRLDNVGCDNLGGKWLEVKNSNGSIGEVWAESCEVEATSGTTSLIDVINSSVNVSGLSLIRNLYAVANGATINTIRVQSGSVLLSDRIVQRRVTRTGPGKVWLVSIGADDRMRNQSYDEYQSSGCSRLADFHDPPSIELFNGQ